VEQVQDLVKATKLRLDDAEIGQLDQASASD
jgi:aryl-alcohol dehydrogenase-like predicted oxidoreductase